MLIGGVGVDVLSLQWGLVTWHVIGSHGGALFCVWCVSSVSVGDGGRDVIG